MGSDDASGVEPHTKATAGMERSLRGLFAIATPMPLTTTRQPPPPRGCPKIEDIPVWWQW